MFSIDILSFMSNFSFKGGTLYRLIPSWGIDLFIPPDSLMGDTISRDTGRGLVMFPAKSEIGYSQVEFLFAKSNRINWPLDPPVILTAR